MIAPHRLHLFSLVGALVYTFAYYFDWALLRYYPLAGTVRWLSPPLPSDQPISWYGWLATAILSATVVASGTPKRVAQSIPADVAWLLPIMLIAATLLDEKRWFWPLH
jgi:hypothetical protein